MDSGAHYYKADFQVHTPRDINWIGGGARTPAERQEYAFEFVAECRKRGLQAVAITDHHDVALFPFIKAAAEAETDAGGHPLAPEQRLVVFPGMELTLGVPCQAIVLLDADFPVTLLPPIPQLFGVAQVDHAAAKHAQIQRLEHIRSFEELYDLLNQQPHLRGRFIVLPNVSEGGNTTLLRAGFTTHYKKMPCVGGYLDGSISQLGEGNRSILEGRNKEWGNKPVGLFQTSDNRKRNFQDLGRHHTWVKWAGPTAEALRQACLARESRISQVEPLVPTVRIVRLEVSNSKFMGPIAVELNPQYNALIGGRGTGKSTLLEYLRWVLGDQPVTLAADLPDLPDFHKRRASLIEKTLAPLDASAQVYFVVNGIVHVVRRYTKGGQLLLKIGDGEFTPCTEADVRNLLPVQAYSQKQLSNVGARADELKRFVDLPVKQQTEAVASRMQDTASKLRLAYEACAARARVATEVSALQLEATSLEQQLATLRASLKNVTPEDQAVIQNQALYSEEDRLVQTWSREVKTIREAFADLRTKLAVVPTKMPDGVKWPSSDLLSKIQTGLSNVYEDALTQVNAMAEQFDAERESTPLAGVQSLAKQWKAQVDAHAAKYLKAKERLSAQDAVLKQIQESEVRYAAVANALQEKKVVLQGLGDPELGYRTLRVEWTNLHGERSALLEKQCEALSALSKAYIQATLLRCAGTIAVESRLKEVLKGKNIKSDKLEGLFAAIRGAAQPIKEWDALVEELRALAEYDAPAQASPLPSTPRLTAAGFGDAERRRIAEKLSPQAWLDLALLDVEDVPRFRYRSREGEYIDFADASAGQQATALMYVLLNQGGPPLIVDQPEDDLDNRVVKDIVTEIWAAKGRRQLIFSSHNANLVVNGDAELVVCCANRVMGDQSGGMVAKLGAIDVEDVRTEITSVMEGGREAFSLRKQKYGF
jgi:chromosome segregation protein